LNRRCVVLDVWVLFNENEIEGIYTSEGNAKYMKRHLENFVQKDGLD
jgi:hypothetical protein